MMKRPVKRGSAAAPKSNGTAMSTPVPQHAAIRTRAFEIFAARNGAPGDALGDWLQAEREVMRGAAPRAVVGRAVKTVGVEGDRGPGSAA